MTVYPPDVIEAGTQALVARLEGVDIRDIGADYRAELEEDVAAVLTACIASAACRLRMLTSITALEDLHAARRLGEPVVLRQAQQYGDLYNADEGWHK